MRLSLFGLLFLLSEFLLRQKLNKKIMKKLFYYFSYVTNNLYLDALMMKGLLSLAMTMVMQKDLTLSVKLAKFQSMVIGIQLNTVKAIK